ncbi:MAG TPA: DoxX family protein [Tepidisphaeraceae bacterium]|nr:DoxX family protein [Tepidisphaeraceae bacterium]
MRNVIKNVLFGGAGATTRFGDLGLLLLRLGVGLGIAIGHGWGKVYADGSLGPSEGFIGNVSKMGMPAPTAAAWLSALTEFLGGLLLAAGLLTRPAAIALVANMCVAAFIAHADAPLWGPKAPNKEFALLYLFAFALFIFTGAGRFSLDKIFRKSSAAARA